MVIPPVLDMCNVERRAKSSGVDSGSARTVTSEKYIAIHILSNFAQHIKFLTQHIIVS